MNTTRLRVFSHALDHLFVVITHFIIFVTIYGFFNLHILLLVVFLIYLIKNYIDGFSFNMLKFSWSDSAIVLIIVAEGVSYATSTYRENSFYSIVDISFLVLFFYWIKYNLKYDYQRTKIYLFLSVIGVLVSIEGILTFLSGYFQMKSVGFSELNDFKHLFYFGSTVGSPTGEWITIYLAFLPFSLIALFINYEKENRKTLLLFIPVLLILLVPMISCNRGMYLAIASFALLGSALFLLYKLSSLRQILLFNTIILLLLGSVVVISPFFNPVLTTVSMFQTTSQVRSFEGRKSLWKAGIKMIKDHPLTGIGSNNFPMKYATYKDQNDDTPYVGRVFNFFLQITIEKGIIGLIAYCSFIFTFFFISHQRIKLLHDDWNHQVVTVLFMSAYAAILIRDLSYSSILYNRGIHLLIWLMFAHNAQMPDRTSPLQSNSTKKTITLIPIIVGLLIFIAIAVSSIRKERAENLLISFIDQLNQNNFIQAEQNLEAAVHISPNNAYYWACGGLLAERVLQRKFNLDKFLTGSTMFDRQEMKQIEAAITSYRKALELNPMDDGLYYNLGWLYTFNRDEKQAESCFRQAIQIDRKNAIYHISLGFLMEKNGKKNSAYEEYGVAVCYLPSLLDSPFFSDLKKRMPIESEQIIVNGIQLLGKKLQQSNDPMISAKLAKLYFFLGEKEKSAILLEQVTKELPGLSRPWLYLGDSYQFMNKKNEVVHCYQKAAYLDTTDFLPILRLGQFYDQHNQDSDAIQYYNRLLSVSSVQYSVHASRVSRMYRSTYKDEKCVVKDDLIPNSLLSYCRPFIDMSAICQRLANLYAKEGDNKKAEKYTRLSKN